MLKQRLSFLGFHCLCTFFLIPFSRSMCAATRCTMPTVCCHCSVTPPSSLPESPHRSLEIGKTSCSSCASRRFCCIFVLLRVFVIRSSLLFRALLVWMFKACNRPSRPIHTQTLIHAHTRPHALHTLTHAMCTICRKRLPHQWAHQLEVQLAQSTQSACWTCLTLPRQACVHGLYKSSYSPFSAFGKSDELVCTHCVKGAMGS